MYFFLDVCGKTIRQVLAKRRFYLDLKSRSVQTTNQLVQDLIALGGVSESKSALSKRVKYDTISI